MKKKIRIFLTFILLMSLSLPVFSETTISNTNVFIGKAPDENIYAYVFSKITDFTDKIKDIGIQIGERWFSIIKNEDYTEFEKAKSSGYFGIGINDEKNILGKTYTAIPKALDSEGNEIAVGNPVVVSYGSEDDARIQSITIGGIEIPNFDMNVYEYHYTSNQLLMTIERNMPFSATMNAYGATYTKNQRYFEDTLFKASIFTVIGRSANGEHTSKYTITINDEHMLPVSDDSDIRDSFKEYKDGVHQGNYMALYPNKQFVLLKYDITGIDSERIRSAKLMVNQYYNYIKENTVYFYEVEPKDWDEETMLESNAPVVYTDKKIGETAINGEISITLDITDYMKRCIDAGNKIMNIAFKTKSEETSLFASKERGAPDNVNVILMDLRRAETAKIPFNTIESPEEKSVTGRINIKVNDEYYYSVNPPYIKDDVIYIKARDFAKINNMSYHLLDDKIIIKDENITIEVSSLNDDTLTLDIFLQSVNCQNAGFVVYTLEDDNSSPKYIKCALKREDTYIPFNELGKYLNISAVYNDNTNTVEITKP